MVLKQDEKNPANTASHWPHPLLLVLFMVGAFLFSQLIISLLFGILLIIFGYNLDQIESLINNSVVLEFVLLCLALILEVFLVVKFIKRRGLELKNVGLVKPKLVDLGWGILTFIAYVPITLAMMSLADWLFPGLDLEQEQDIGFTSADTALELIIVFLGLVIITAIIEEFLTRGVLYHGLKARVAAPAAAILTSIIFAAAHLGSAAEQGALLWSAAIDTFVLSLVLIFLVQRTKTLWPGIFVHIFKNSLAFIFIFLR